MTLTGSKIGDLNNCCYTDSNKSDVSAVLEIEHLILQYQITFYYVKNGFALYSFIFQIQEKMSYNISQNVFKNVVFP